MLMGAKCPPNVDPKTGFRVGFCDGQAYPDLMDKIMSQGIDLSYTEWLEDLRSRVISALSALSETERKTEAEWRSFFKDLGIRMVDHNVPSYVITELVSLVDLDSGTFDIQELRDVFIDDAVEHFNGESTRWLWDRDGVRISLNTGNGATLAVEKSPFIVMCKRCSPCCPNAGDLDNAWCGEGDPDEEAGEYPLPTYGIPPALAVTPYAKSGAMIRLTPEPETEKTK